MSLRMLFRLALLLLLGGALLAIAPWWRERHTPGPVVNDDFRQFKNLAQVTRGTVLAVGGPWLEFALPPSAGAVRITTNANLADLRAARELRRADPQQRWHYALEIQEIGHGGATRHRVHQFRRDLQEVALPNGGRGTGAFYLERDAPSPLAATVLRLEFAGAERPQRLRIRLAAAGPGIADVLLRVAIPEPVTQRTAESAWRRLSDAQRARLAAGNLFPPELLDEQERANVIASRWRPIGPAAEVVARDIYLLDIPDRGPLVEPVQPPIRLAGPGRVVAVHLPEQGATLRVQLEPRQPNLGFPAQVTLRWAGHSAFQRSQSRHIWSGGSFEREVRFGGGWLEIGSSVDAAVRVTLTRMPDAAELTEPPRFLRTWAAQPDAPVEFLVSHAGRDPTPFRLVLRRMHTQAGGFAGSVAKVDLLDPKGQALRSFELAMRPLVASLHDAPWPELPGDRVSDPLEAFFRLPEGVARVRVASADPLLVNAYARPADLARSVRTPEDTRVPGAAQSAIPGWFPLQPDEADARILNNASRLLTVQVRLPDDRPELAAGQFQWEAFEPVNPGAARVFLAPREPGVPDRVDGLAGTFRPLPAETGTYLAPPGRSTVPARLTWVTDSARTFHYSVSLDGQPWTAGAASGIAGEVVLPPFPPGPHRIAVSADTPGRWYVNHLQAGTPWVRRLAFQFDQPLQFEIDRSTTQEEFLSVRVFRPAGERGRLQVRVEIQPPRWPDPVGPYAGWLFTQRIHDVRPSGEFALPVAETRGERSDAGQPFFVPLPKDAPPGRYRITLRPEGGRAWVSASRITPGAGSGPALILESKRDGE